MGGFSPRRIHYIASKPPRIPGPNEVKRVVRALEARYGSPRHGNPLDPLDDLVYILLSNRTGPAVAQQVYERLRRRSGNWGAARRIAMRQLRSLLRPAGLANKRAEHLKGLLRQLERDFGEPTLAPLHNWPDDQVERYLTSLPGVSRKVAKCVMMYTLGRAVLPVDVHVHRVTRRLGWHCHKRADQSHDTLEALVPPAVRYSLHVNCIAHGREVCTAATPKCASCVVSPNCHYFLSIQSPEGAILAPRMSGGRRVAEPKLGDLPP